MKRYLIACIDSDLTSEDTTSDNIIFSKPKVFTYESGQMTDGIASKYRRDYRVESDIPLLIVALDKGTSADTASIIAKTLGKSFNFEKLLQFKMYIDNGVSICIDALIDCNAHFDIQSILPDSLLPSMKRIDIYAKKA